jgi:hypothetical protein
VSEEQDPVVNRAIDELRQLPPLDRDAVQRVVRAAAAARVAPADDIDVGARPRSIRGVRSIRIWSAAGLAAAAAIAGFVAGDLRMERKQNAQTLRTMAAAPATAESAVPTVQVANDPSAVIAIPQQFVFEHKSARRVTLVGDFNNWNPQRTPMTRSDSGIWSVVLPVMPGRHVYAFMVDDSVLTLDPRKPKARDPDLGNEGSVLMVGRP